MKKALSFILALMLCLSLCACGGDKGEGNADESTTSDQVVTETPEPEIEMVLFDDLITDLENEAKAQLNVGKGANILAQVDTIKSDYCSVTLFHKDSHRAKILLPTEVLAEMKVDQVIAVTAIIDSIESSIYVFKADRLGDLSLMETYINDKIALIDESETGSTLYSAIKNRFGMSMLYDYLEQSGNSFCKLSDAELKEYLYGKWFYNYAREWNLDDETIELYEDGTQLWKYNYQTSGLKNWVGREQEGTWSVIGNDFHLSHNGTGRSKNVYILSENAFIWSDRLYTREK